MPIPQPGGIITPTGGAGGGIFPTGSIMGNPCFTGFTPYSGGAVTVQCVDVSCVLPNTTITYPKQYCGAPGGGGTGTTAGGGTTGTTAASPPPPPPPPPPPLPPPPPPPGCVVNSSVPPAYAAASYTVPAGSVSLSSDLAAAYTGQYPLFVLWVNSTTQVAYVDISGQSNFPQGPWYYAGATDLQSLLAGGCSVSVGMPSPPPPPPSFPACDATVYLALPIPGTPEFCAALPQILGQVKLLGTQLLSFTATILQDAEDQGYDWAQAGKAMKSSLTAPFDGVLGWFQSLAGYFVEGAAYSMRQVVCWLANGAIRSDACDPTTYAMVLVANIAWESIKHARFGVNFGVELEVDLRGKDVVPFIDRTLEYLINYICPVEIPSHGDAIEAFLANRITLDQFQCWMRMRGASPAVWQPVIDARREQMTSVEIIEAIRRDSLGDTTLWNPQSPYTADEAGTEKAWHDASVKYLRNIGWLYSTDADPFIRNYDELPTIADHMHWLMRNVDDSAYVYQYNLLDGFSTDADCAALLGAGGYTRLPQVGQRNFWAVFGAELRAQGMRKIDAARHYAAHWLHAAPVQMQHFLWRLRPDREMKPWEVQVATDLGLPSQVGGPPPPQMTFEVLDYTKLLSEQDYSPRDVAWFAATQYQIPALSYIQNMYRYGVIDEKELQGYHLDLGYSLPDSERFVGVDQKFKRRLRMSEAHAWTPALLSSALALGMITADENFQWMSYQGFTGDEIRAHQSAATFQLRGQVLRRAMSYSVSRLMNQTLDSYREGIPAKADVADALKGLGIPDDRAEAMIAAVDTQRLTGLVRQTKTTLKRAYMQGRLDDAGTLAALQALMKDGDVVQLTMDSWSAQKMASEKTPTIAEIKRYVREGLIELDEARQRLMNLNLKADNVDLIIDELEYLDEQQSKKEQARKEKDKQRQQLAQERIQEKLAVAQARAAAQETKAADAAAAKEAKTAAQAESRAEALQYREEMAASRLAQTQARRRASEMVRAAKQAYSYQQRIISALRKDEPPAQLNKWAKLGLIDYSYYHTRMQLYGYTDESIEQQWRAACSAASAACIDGPSAPQSAAGADVAAAAAGITAAAEGAALSAAAAAEAAQNALDAG